MPPTLRPSDLQPLWHRALEAEIGLAIKVTGRRDTFQGMLYKAKGEIGLEALDAIAVVLPGTPEDEVWMVKRGTEMPTDA